MSRALIVDWSVGFPSTTFGRAVREHRGVENKVHSVMDSCFPEDKSGARTSWGAVGLTGLRGQPLNLLKRERTKTGGHQR